MFSVKTLVLFALVALCFLSVVSASKLRRREYDQEEISVEDASFQVDEDSASMESDFHAGHGPSRRGRRGARRGGRFQGGQGGMDDCEEEGGHSAPGGEEMPVGGEMPTGGDQGGDMPPPETQAKMGRWGRGRGGRMGGRGGRMGGMYAGRRGGRMGGWA